jgi:hypothetical protein
MQKASGEDTQPAALCSVLVSKYYSDDQIKKNEMGGSCSIHERKKEVHTGFGWGGLMEKDHLEDLSVGRRTILKRIFKT